MRAREYVFSPLPGLPNGNKNKVYVDTYLFVVVLFLVAKAVARLQWAMLEQPEDPGEEPYPSFLNSEPVKWVERAVGMNVHVTLF